MKKREKGGKSCQKGRDGKETAAERDNKREKYREKKGEGERKREERER